MRTYKTKFGEELYFTEKQYRMLLRRFNPEKVIGRRYNYRCICPKTSNEPICNSCKAFGYRYTACMDCLRELTGMRDVIPGLGLFTDVIIVRSEEGMRSLKKVYLALLDMKRLLPSRGGLLAP